MKIGTPQDDGQGFLSGHQFFPAQVKSPRSALTLDKSLIAGQEIFQGYFGAGRRPFLLRPMLFPPSQVGC